VVVIMGNLISLCGSGIFTPRGANLTKLPCHTFFQLIASGLKVYIWLWEQHLCNQVAQKSDDSEILPTGLGKGLSFQLLLPHLLKYLWKMERACVLVVMPVMKDQVDTIRPVMTPLQCCRFHAAMQQPPTISVVEGSELLVVLFKANIGSCTKSIPCFRFLKVFGP